MLDKLRPELDRAEIEYLVTLVSANVRPVVSWLLFDVVLLSRLEDALCGSAEAGHAMRKARARKEVMFEPD